MGFRKPIRSATTALAMACALLCAVHAGAQQSSSERTRLFDEDQIRGYDYTGAYRQLGLSVGQIDFDFNNGDNEASGGFTLAGGYRFLPWLAADANFTFMGGEDNVEIGNNDFDSSYFAFTFGPKVYPLGFLDPEDVPHVFQPYSLFAIGGGEFDVEDTNFDDRSAFIARIILGFDVWVTDHLGLFVEGGGHVTPEDDVDGVGIFTTGGQYRF